MIKSIIITNVIKIFTIGNIDHENATDGEIESTAENLLKHLIEKKQEKKEIR